MSITNEQYEAFLAQYAALDGLAYNFAKAKDPRAQDVRLEADGQVSYEINTACNCHPEYERQWIGSDEFIAFLNQQSTN
jgi:hypothetical protein